MQIREVIPEGRRIRPVEGLVAVGGRNIQKAKAVTAGVSERMPVTRTQPVDVVPGVVRQPCGIPEILLGAHGRAHGAWQGAPRAMLAFGLESGIVEGENGLATVAGIWAVRHDGVCGVGMTDAVDLPEAVANGVEQGLEVHDAIVAAMGEAAVVDRDCITPITGGAMDAQAFFLTGVRRALDQLYGDR